MNRKERRATFKRGNELAHHGLARPQNDGRGILDQVAVGWQHYRQGQFAQAEAVCRKILARDTAQVDAINLLGFVLQASGQHNRAVKFFARLLRPAEEMRRIISTSHCRIRRWNAGIMRPRISHAVSRSVSTRNPPYRSSSKHPPSLAACNALMSLGPDGSPIMNCLAAPVSPVCQAKCFCIACCNRPG